MKILFIYPQINLIIGDGHRDGLPCTITPPLGALYLSSYLTKEGHSVKVIDYNAEVFNYESLANEIRSSDMVCMTVISSYTISPSSHSSLKLTKAIREIDPDIPFIIGGPHCSLYPEESLNYLNATVSVEGEAELVINDIAKAFEGKKDLSIIPGIYYKENGAVKKGMPPTFYNNLDEILFPSRDLVKKYQYGTAYISKAKAGEFTSLITTRGCPSRCTFCQRNFFGMKSFRMRSSENVIEELREIYSQGYKYAIFVDDNFLTDVKRAIRIMDGIIKEKIDMRLYIMGARVDSANRELYEKMRDAGVVWVSYGIESGNQEVLDFYNKGITLAKIKEAVELGDEMGFLNAGTFILGAPMETKKHFDNTIRFAQSLRLDEVEFFRLEYRTGSKLWEDAVKEGKIKPTEYEVSADVGRGLSNYTKEYIQDYCRKAFLRFYIRPSYRINQMKKKLKNENFRFAKNNFPYAPLI